MPVFPTNWIQPEWPAPAHVRAVMTDRQGGVSGPPWDSMNLGDHVGDVPEHVGLNRARLQQLMGLRPVFLRQVHGDQVAPMHELTPDGTVADACMTNHGGLACTIMVADCLPVLLCDVRGRWVAAAHAGWRGLAGHQGRGVLENLVDTVTDAYGTAPGDMLAWLGPCIGPQAFEVGPEVRQAFAVQGQEPPFFEQTAGGKFMADLAGLARWRLARLGIQSVWGNNSEPLWCTASQASRFFSHRRDGIVLGSSGRMAACIGLVR